MHTSTYESLNEIAKVALKRKSLRIFEDMRGRRKFFGLDSVEKAVEYALNGWDRALPEAMAIAESVIETVEKDLDQVAFRPAWDVTGCEVDVGRYLSGEPENMIDYEITQAPRNGRVITLCSSVAVSCGVSAASIKRRGQAVVGLALALNRLGLATELWADASHSVGSGSDVLARSRVLVKGANDELDPARIMFAYSHSAMNRVLGFASMHDYPTDLHDQLGVGSHYGYPSDPVKDLPEGTIYLPCVRSSSDVPDADVAVRRHLQDLGIIGE